MATWQVCNKNKEKLDNTHTIFTFHAKNSMAALNKIRKWLRLQGELTNMPDYYRYSEEDAFSIHLFNKEDIISPNLHNEYLDITTLKGGGEN